jgi:hypothetical protein
MDFMLSAYRENLSLTAVIIGATVAAILLVRRSALREGGSPWLPMFVVLLIGSAVLALMPFALFLLSCAHTGDCV